MRHILRQQLKVARNNYDNDQSILLKLLMQTNQKIFWVLPIFLKSNSYQRILPFPYKEETDKHICIKWNLSTPLLKRYNVFLSQKHLQGEMNHIMISDPAS